MSESFRGRFDGTIIKVLSIDGGGIRGIIPAMILAELEKRCGRRLHESFDLISGTSTGGIIALAVGTRLKDDGPYRPDDLVDMYVKNGPDIFRKSFFTCPKSLVRPKYSADPLERVLKGFFGEAMFSTALIPLLISSYDIEAELPFFFKSHKIRGQEDSEYDWRVCDIARATSAAPTYFPPAHLTKGRQAFALVDGGVAVNNPAMAAFAEANRMYSNAASYLVVAVGTGDRQDSYAYRKARKWGLLGWASRIVPVFMDSVSETADYELESIPSCKLYRLQPPCLVPASNSMDDASPANLMNLQKVAQKYIQSADETLNQIAEKLKTGRGGTLTGTGLEGQLSTLPTTHDGDRAQDGGEGA